jgi:hypothetical protein
MRANLLVALLVLAAAVAWSQDRGRGGRTPQGSSSVPSGRDGDERNQGGRQSSQQVVVSGGDRGTTAERPPKPVYQDDRGPIILPSPEPAVIVVPVVRLRPSRPAICVSGSSVFRVVRNIVVLEDLHRFPGLAGYDFSERRVRPFDNDDTDVFFEVWEGVPYLNVHEDSDIQYAGVVGSLDDIRLEMITPTGWAEGHYEEAILAGGYVIRLRDNTVIRLTVLNVAAGRVEFEWAYFEQHDHPSRPIGVTRVSGGPVFGR